MNEKDGSRMPWIILTILTLLYVLNYVDRMIVAVSMEAIKADFNFTDAQTGMIQSAYYLGVGILTLPAGVLLDQLYGLTAFKPFFILKAQHDRASVPIVRNVK